MCDARNDSMEGRVAACNPTSSGDMDADTGAKAGNLAMTVPNFVQ